MNGVLLQCLHLAGAGKRTLPPVLGQKVAAARPGQQYIPTLLGKLLQCVSIKPCITEPKTALFQKRSWASPGELQEWRQHCGTKHSCPQALLTPRDTSSSVSLQNTHAPLGSYRTTRFLSCFSSQPMPCILHQAKIQQSEWWLVSEQPFTSPAPFIKHDPADSFFSTPGIEEHCKAFE